MGHFVPPPVSNRSLLPSARSSLQSSRLRRLRNEGDGRVNEVSETVTEGRRQSDRGGKGRFGLSTRPLHRWSRSFSRYTHPRSGPTYGRARA